MATLTLTIFCILLIICIATNHFILYALFAGLVLFSFYSRKQGYTWKSIGKMILQGIKKVRNILFTFILIGMLTAALASGRDDSCNHLLYDSSDKTIYFSSYDVSFELPCFCADGDFFRNRGNDGRCLCDNRVNTWYPSVDGRRGNLVWHLFWRPLFTGINERTSCL